MSQQDNLLHVQLIKEDDRLIYIFNGEKMKHDEFVKALEPGQRVDMLMEAFRDNGSNIQLAKIHACIRKLAMESGYTFSKMKEEVKKMCGLCFKTHEHTEVYKSFADCSSEELGLAIETIIEIGETVGINFRGTFPEYHQGL